MKFYRYWVREDVTLELDGYQQGSAVFGHSDTSLEDARADALRTASAIQERIRLRQPRPRDYDVAVREEIIERIDDRNLISRNRYGALVLNSEDTMFIDIDEPSGGLLGRLFGRVLGRAAEKKAEMVKAVEKTILQSAPCRGLGFRIYETRRGLRLIVLGRVIAARSEESGRLMAEFGADELYALLCVKQDCYRARLTPKPSRMRLKAFRVTYPRNARDQAALATWLSGYEAKSAEHAVCRFVQQIGPGVPTPIVELHDRRTGAGTSLRLA